MEAMWEEELWQEKKKKKEAREREAREGEAREKECWEAEERACKERLEEIRKKAKLKLVGIIRQEKYDWEFLHLWEYWDKNLTATQWWNSNINDHSAYLASLLDIQSLYPHNTVCLAEALVQLLKDQEMGDKADQAQATLDARLSAFTPAGVSIKDVWALYFIWILQKSDSAIIDTNDEEYGEDQNIGLHDIVSQQSMRRTNTTQRVNVPGGHAKVRINLGFCLFCAYYSGCHWTLNNHVQVHLQLSLFCGIGDCFYITHNAKTMIDHALAMHKELYTQVPKIT